jgi:hypothetical protein
MEVWRKNDPPLRDLLVSLRDGQWHRRDGNPRGAEAPPARQVPVIPPVVGQSVPAIPSVKISILLGVATAKMPNSRLRLSLALD